MARYDFASDNVAGAMPEVMEALLAANAGTASGYGTDHVSKAAADRIRGLLDADAEVRFTASGTAANAFALTLLAAPHEAVLAHEHAHIRTDETGAPGFFGQGVGLIGLPGASGKIELSALEAALARPKPSDPRVAERFELYACGVELANCFGELTDPAEQRRRFQAEMDEKARVYGERYPIDEDFINALGHMPQASGGALGFDRLAMLATGASRIEDVLWAPVPEPD